MSAFLDSKHKGVFVDGPGAIESPYNLPVISADLARFNQGYQTAKDYAVHNTAWGGPHSPQINPDERTGPLSPDGGESSEQPTPDASKPSPVAYVGMAALAFAAYWYWR